MKQEDKELLLQDLSARLPYNIKIQLTEYSDLTGEKLPSKIKILDYCMLGKVQAYCKGFRKDEIKPYLFPLSSMTEEQNKELHDKLIELELQALNGEINRIDAVKFEIDYYLENHIDYRGLIEKGLAIDASNLNVY